MGFKITDYPAKTGFDDGDLMDVSSYDGVSVYASEKMTYSQLKTDLNSNLSFLTSVPSGVLGIADANGVYTYYSDFASANAAASAGDTIELFSDITETGAVTVTLVEGVKYNFNGHTYTLDNTGSTSAVITPNSTGTIYLFNGKIKRTNGTGVHSALNVSQKTVIGNNFQVENTHERACLSTGIIYNIDFFNSGSGICLEAGTSEIHNCSAKSTSSHGISSSGKLYNCRGFSTAGRGIQGSPNAGEFYDCTGYSTGGHGILGGEILTRCTGYSTSNYGISIYSAGGTLLNCVAYSEADYGINAAQNAKIHNCTIVSESSYALFCSAGGAGDIEITNNSITSHGLMGCYLVNTTTDANTKTIFSGNRVRTTATAYDSMRVSNNASNLGMFVSLNEFELVDSTQNCLTNTAATTVSYVNNVFSSIATTPVNANITQGTTNVADSQGNTQF